MIEIFYMCQQKFEAMHEKERNRRQRMFSKGFFFICGDYMLFFFRSEKFVEANITQWNLIGTDGIENKYFALGSRNRFQSGTRIDSK